MSLSDVPDGVVGTFRPAAPLTTAATDTAQFKVGSSVKTVLTTGATASPSSPILIAPAGITITGHEFDAVVDVVIPGMYVYVTSPSGKLVDLPVKATPTSTPNGALQTLGPQNPVEEVTWSSTFDSGTSGATMWGGATDDQVLGPPNSPCYCDREVGLSFDSWSGTNALTVSFPKSVVPNAIVVYESFGAETISITSAILRISGVDSQSVALTSMTRARTANGVYKTTIPYGILTTFFKKKSRSALTAVDNLQTPMWPTMDCDWFSLHQIP